jgi:hypothetical protein
MKTYVFLYICVFAYSARADEREAFDRDAKEVRAFAEERSLAPGVALHAVTFVGQPRADGLDVTRQAVRVGARVALVHTAGAMLAIEAGGLREVGGASGGFVELSASWDRGRFRLAGTLHAEKVFAPGRDAIDVWSAVAATVRVAAPLRIGVEWLGLDLEESGDDGAEGGPQHFAGPDLALSLGKRLALTAALLARLDGGATYGRAALACAF